MLHFSCDLCGKELAPGTGPRYVVKMEVYAADDPAELTEEDLAADHMDEMSQALEDEDADGPITPAYKKLRYDLCPHCHQKFLRDPLSKETATKFDFSEN